MSSVPQFKLNTGAEMPAIGLGGWAGLTAEERKNAAEWMTPALKQGYRHIDTAHGYGTEAATGQAVRESGIPREELFITTKMPPQHADIVQDSFKESLANSGLDYYDLYLVHWPQAIKRNDQGGELHAADGHAVINDDWHFSQTWAEMEKVHASGKAKAIGVSNFSVKTLEELLKTAKAVPAVNQVEMHPLLAQNDLLEYCRSKGIVITAYTPTGYDTVRSHPVIQEIAKKHNVSGAQICLSWHAARGVVAVPRSKDPQRQKDNLTLVKLDEEDMAKINAMDKGERLCNKIDESGRCQGWKKEQFGW